MRRDPRKELEEGQAAVCMGPHQESFKPGQFDRKAFATSARCNGVVSQLQDREIAVLREGFGAPFVVGFNPLHAPGRVVAGRTFINIYTGPLPGVAIENTGIHADLNLLCFGMFSAALSRHGIADGLSVEREAEFRESAISGWVRPTDIPPYFSVTIRPDRPGDMLFEAETVLRQLGVPPHAIWVNGGGSDDEILRVKEMGWMHRITPLCGDEKEFLRAHRRTLSAGVEYDYCPSRGERLLSFSGFRWILRQIFSASDPQQSQRLFERYLGEVVTFSRRRSVSGQGREVDLLVVKHDLHRQFETKRLLDKLAEAFEEGLARHPWGADDRAAMQERLGALERCWASSNHLLFHQDRPHDSRWRRIMYAILLGRSGQEDLDKLGEEFRGLTNPRPGGFIGYVDELGHLRCGMQTLTPVQAEELFGKQFVARLAATGELLIEAQKDWQSDTSCILRRTETGNIVAQRFMFHFGATQRTKDLLNDTLRETFRRGENLRYAFLQEVLVSLCDRDPVVDPLRKFGVSERCVDVLVSAAEKAGSTPRAKQRLNESKQLIRRADITTALLEHVFERRTEDVSQYSPLIEQHLKAQRACVRLLGVSVPEIEVVRVREEIPGDGSRLVEYTRRDFLTSPPVNRINRFEARDSEQVLNQFEAEGWIAAVENAVRRRYFKDGDEGGAPPHLVLFDATSAVPSLELIQGTGPEDDAGLYAARLAADLFAITRTAHRGLSGPQLARLALEAWIKEFDDHWEELRREERLNGDKWRTVVAGYYEGLSIPRRLKDFDLRPSWDYLLSRLRTTDARVITNTIRERTVELGQFLDYVTSPVEDLEQLAQLVQEAEALLASCWWPTRNMSQARVMKTVRRDNLFKLFNGDDRRHCLAALRANSWASQMGISVKNDLTPLARACRLEQRDDTLAVDRFRAAVAARYPKLARQPFLAEKLFLALYEEPRAALRRKALLEGTYLG